MLKKLFKNMTSFEIFYICLEPFLPHRYKIIRKELKKISRISEKRPKILDIGGRKSNYTIGINADITITDLPKETEIQNKLNLGINTNIGRQLYKRRSNLLNIVFDDMRYCSFSDSSYDCIIAIDVLEHVNEDFLFLNQVYRVLKTGGIFLMTTPNGEFVENNNPDHFRHYNKEQLATLLDTKFDQFHILPIIRGGYFYNLGLKSWAYNKPLQTILSMIGNVLNSIQSGCIFNKTNSVTQYLLAFGKKT